MKIIIINFCLMLVSLSLFCDDWEFIVMQESPIYTTTAKHEPLGFLYKGKKIITNNKAGYGMEKEGAGEMPYIGFVPDNEFPFIQMDHVTDARNIIPANTIELFGVDITGNEKSILVSYCIDILKSRDRETLLNYELYFKDEQSYFHYAYDRDVYWYEEYNSTWAGFFVFNAVLGFGRHWALIVNNIEKKEYGYIVRCKESEWNNIPALKMPTIEWDYLQGKQEFNLIIYIDGDYVDLYVDSNENKMGTFVFVTNEFIKQFNNLIKTDTCDLTNVQWPKRAEGSTGSSPPPLYMINYSTTHRTLDALRLRDAASTASELVATMPKGTEVQVVEIGSVATIGGITAPWVKVVSSTWYTGWCFSGYLEEVEKPETVNNTDSAIIIESQENAVSKNDASSISFPLWAWVAVVGGAIILVGGVALVVAKRKKQQ